LLRQSLFPPLHSSKRRLPRRRPDRLCRWAIIACHMTWVAPTAVLQAMHNVRPPRRDSPPYATARPFATTSTTAHGAPVASSPCGQREAIQFLQSRRSGKAISTLHAGPGRSSGKNMQLHDGGDEAEATGPDSAVPPRRGLQGVACAISLVAKLTPPPGDKRGGAALQMPASRLNRILEMRRLQADMACGKLMTSASPAHGREPFCHQRDRRRG
jgi:hypothetical protein